jgi:hypothetical protein
MNQPLQRMVQYARRAGFDFVVSNYNRQHLHWFTEAGVSNAAWLPGLPVQHLPRPFDYPREQRLAFIGQAGRFHPRRLRLLQDMERAQLPIQARRADHEAAAEAFARSILSFNASLNGDLNLRIFEVLSAGGCLLTDRLAAESGLSEILEEDRHMICYGTVGELLDKAQFYLARPDIALKIARAGHEHFVANLLPDRQRSRLMDWVFDGRLDTVFQPGWDVRPAMNANGPVPLINRIRLYEHAQARHQERERVSVLFGPGVPPCHLTDLIDLPRIDAAVIEPSAAVAEAMRHPQFQGRIETLTWEAAAMRRWDYLFLPAADMADRARVPHQTLAAC